MVYSTKEFKAIKSNVELAPGQIYVLGIKFNGETEMQKGKSLIFECLSLKVNHYYKDSDRVSASYIHNFDSLRGVEDTWQYKSNSSLWVTGERVVRLATEEEKKWLKVCQMEHRFIPREEIENFSFKFLVQKIEEELCQ